MMGPGASQVLACPHCGLPLSLSATGATCERHHSFDRGRGGYLNLLVGGRLSAATTPGDTPDALAARRRFLGAGHYAPIAAAVAAVVGRLAVRGRVRVSTAGARRLCRRSAVGICAAPVRRVPASAAARRPLAEPPVEAAAARRVQFELQLDASALRDLFYMTPIRWQAGATGADTDTGRAVSVDVWVSSSPA